MVEKEKKGGGGTEGGGEGEEGGEGKRKIRIGGKEDLQESSVW